MTSTNQSQPAVSQALKAKSTAKGQSVPGGKAIPYFISDKPGKYRATRVLTEAQIIEAALAISVEAVSRGEPLASPQHAQLFLESKLKGYEREVFAVLFLDGQHRVIAFEEMFKGTVDTAPVFPRVVLQRALQLNAAAVIFAHNHPSGNTEPSLNDKAITNRLKQVLALVEIRVLDHFIIGDRCFSFAEHGLI